VLAAVTRSPGEMAIEDVSGPGGGLAERLEVPAGLVFAVGDLDPDCASFVEPASVAVHALARGRLAAGEQVVVFGAGVIGSSCATAGDFRAAIKLVAANRTAISALFSHHFPLARAAEAFEFAMSRPPDAVKIVVTVN
jgi:threonine dehydrogenase-like Zn-dependent dehydrogenase